MDKHVMFQLSSLLSVRLSDVASIRVHILHRGDEENLQALRESMHRRGICRDGRCAFVSIVLCLKSNFLLDAVSDSLESIYKVRSEDEREPVQIASRYGLEGAVS